MLSLPLVLLAAGIGILFFWNVLFWSFGRRVTLSHVPGSRLVDTVSGQRVFALGAKPSQGPTVVFVHGGAGNHQDWKYVIERIPAHINWFAYDRLGLGWSDSTPEERSLDALVEELASAAQEAQLSKPYLLVGYSFGGMIALEFARKFENLSAGLILVDPMHPGQFDDTVISRAGQREDREALAKMSRMSWMGYFNLGTFRNAWSVFALGQGNLNSSLSGHHVYGTAQEMRLAIANTITLRERKHLALGNRLQCLTLVATLPVSLDLPAAQRSQQSMTETCQQAEFEPVAGASHEYFVSEEYAPELTQKIVNMISKITVPAASL